MKIDNSMKGPLFAISVVAGLCAALPSVSAAEAQNASGAAENIRTVQDARNVLKYATGKFCPSLFCGVAGYAISAINLTDDGQTLVFIHDDGTRGDTLPVSSLNPKDATFLGQGVVQFTGDFAPNLVTTNVEVKRLLAALDVIKHAPPAALASGITQTQTASAPSGPTMAAGAAPPPAAPAITPPPTVASASAPVPLPAIAANTPPPVSSGYGGKRLAIRILQSCPSDPDPLGILPGNDFYSDCAQDELDKLKSWIGASLATKGVFGQIGDDNPDFILTVTLTQSMATEGVAGIFTDLAPATLEFTATYQLADSKGQILKSDTVHHEDAEAYFGGNEDAVEQQFADKIAAAVAAGTGAGASGVGGANVATLQAAPPGLQFGVKMMDLAPSDAEGLGHPGMTGVLVVNYVIGSAADKAGIRSGDVIYEFDGNPVADAKSLTAAIAAEPAGKAVTVKLLHEKQEASVTVQF